MKATGQRNILKASQLLAIWFIPFLGGLTISLMYMVHPAHGGWPYKVGLTDHSDGVGDSG